MGSRKKGRGLQRYTAAELGEERFATLLACLALRGEPITVGEHAPEERPGLEYLQELARADARWARVVLDIVEGRREMPKQLDPPVDDHVAVTAWHIRAAMLVAAAGHVPDLTDEDRRTLAEILTVADDDYDDVLEHLSEGAVTPATKLNALVLPLRRILDVS